MTFGISEASEMAQSSSGAVVGMSKLMYNRDTPSAF